MKFVRIICALLAAVLTVAAIGCAVVDQVLFSDSFAQDIVDDAYVQYVHEQMAKEFKRSELYYGFSTQCLIDAIDDDHIRTVCLTYFEQFHQVLLGERTSIAPIDYPIDDFKNGILAYAKSIGQEDVDAEMIREVLDDAAEIVALNIAIIPQDYLQAASRLTASRVIALVKLYPFFALAALLLAAICAFLSKKRWQSASLASAAIFFPSFAVALLMILIKAYDFGAKLFLVASQLKLVAIHLYNQTCSIAIRFSAIPAAISFVLLLVCLVVRSKKILRKESTF